MSKFNNESDDESISSFNNEKIEKKIFPIYNENNFYITKEIIQSILEKGKIYNEINNIDVWQQ